MPDPTLDHIDQKIIHALIEDGRASVETIAQSVGLSPTPARRRIKRLENEGFITGYRAEIDAEKCGLELFLYVLVTLTVGSADTMADFEAAIQKLPEIHKCDLIAGANCYILSLRLKNMKQYNDYLRNTLVKLPSVYAVETRTVIGHVKNSAQIAFPQS